MTLPAFLNNQMMSVDSKLRVGIPERFIRVLKKICPDHFRQIGVAATPDRSIMLMPHPYFMDELQAWSRLDPRNSDQRTFLNLSASYADLLTMDPQNRIKLSPQLCDYCNIRAGEKALVVGSIQYMQLFNPDLWTSLFDGGMARFDRAANAVADRQNAPRPINLYLEAMNGKQRDESHADDE